MGAYRLDDLMRKAIAQWEPPKSAAHLQLERLHLRLPKGDPLAESLWEYLVAVGDNDPGLIRDLREQFQREEAVAARILGDEWHRTYSAAVAEMVAERTELGRRRFRALEGAIQAAGRELLDSDGIRRIGWGLVDELVVAAEHVAQLLDRHDRLVETIEVLANDNDTTEELARTTGGHAVWEVLGFLVWRIDQTTGESESFDPAKTLDELRRRVAAERVGGDRG